MELHLPVQENPIVPLWLGQQTDHASVPDDEYPALNCVILLITVILTLPIRIILRTLSLRLESLPASLMFLL